jgi:polyisoprenoid-binding protein YceI
MTAHLGSAITEYGQARAGRYRIDAARSEIAFVLRNRLGIFPVRGTFAVRAGEVELAATPAGSRVHAVVDAGSFRSGIARRDKDVCSRRFLDVASVPDLTFTGAATGDGRAVVGRVTRGGFDTAATLELTGAESIEDGYQVTAVSRVDRWALGVTAARGAGQYLELVLRVVLTRI